MTFSASMFAKHRQGTAPALNTLALDSAQLVLDFSGFETTPFLNQVLGINLNKLLAPGLGIKGQLASGAAFTVYYFSETAYRFVIDAAHADELQNLVEAHHSDYDIELVARNDLSMSTLSGELAFDTIIKQFALTPGLRLSDDQVCYGRQSGDVFVTALLNDDLQQYQLIAQTDTLNKWHQQLQAQGFSLN
jgi:aminomethyltransferase